jgi:LAGLIDADG endonuclease
MKQKYNTQALKSYFSGYVDGEGCFSVSFSKRPKLLSGWEVKPSFAIGQNSDRAQVLELMKKYLNCGHIRKDKKTLKYEVRKLEDLLEIIIPHFLAFPMLSTKQKDFLKFKKICEQIKKQEHLKKETLSKIMQDAYSMNGSDNRSGRRKRSLESILRSLR